MRLKVLLGVVVASIFMVFATTATAAHLSNPPNFSASGDLDEPLNTNIPYLAWLGEEVRLVKCYDRERLLNGGLITPAQHAGLGNLSQFLVDFDVITWSGDPHFKPIVEEASIRIFTGTGAHAGEPCVSADVYSSKAGLGQIEMAVNIQGLTFNGSSQFDKHTFLVGWMAILDTNIDELSCTEFGAPRTAAGACRLSDPLGDGNLGNGPGFGGRIRAVVRGVIPTDQDSFAGLFDGNDLVLPDEYREMANVLAEDSLPNVDGSNDIARWDIHDDEAATEGHLTEENGCLPDAFNFDQNPDTTNDAVDNCGPFFALLPTRSFLFSNIFNNSGTGVGPFDPTSPATLLSDGKVDLYDAPMPSLRLDFTASGRFGTLREVTKLEVYSRNGQGDFGLHNLYAPYYYTYLPATERPVAEASGIAGPRQINNAEGFLDGGREDNGVYEYWNFADVLSSNVTSSCLLRDPSFRGGAGLNAIFRGITGPRRVAIYTDEHGIAYIDVERESGIANIPEANINENGGCDLTGLPLTATISAVAKYPYKPIPGFKNGVPAVQTLGKSIGNLFQKGITCRPKTGPGVPNIFICTVFAIDFDGSIGRFADNPNTPLVNEGEVVCLTTGDGVDDVQLDDKFLKVDQPAGLVGRNLICTRLNSKGQAIFEPEGSGGVNALFVEEELKRITTLGAAPVIIPTAPIIPVVAPTAPVTPVVAPVVLPSNNTQAQNPAPATTSVVVSLAGAPVPSAAAAQPTKTATVAKATLQSAKLVAVNGKRALVVRVTSTAKVAKIQLRLINKAGKVTKFVRTVKTNKVVRVPNLVIPKGITRVSVSVL